LLETAKELMRVGNDGMIEERERDTMAVFVFSSAVLFSLVSEIKREK